MDTYPKSVNSDHQVLFVCGEIPRGLVKIIADERVVAADVDK